MDEMVDDSNSGQLVLQFAPGLTVTSETVATLQGLSQTKCGLECLLSSNCTAINYCTDSQGGSMCELENEAVGVTVTAEENNACVYYSAYDYSELV